MGDFAINRYFRILVLVSLFAALPGGAAETNSFHPDLKRLAANPLPGAGGGKTVKCKLEGFEAWLNCAPRHPREQSLPNPVRYCATVAFDNRGKTSEEVVMEPHAAMLVGGAWQEVTTEFGGPNAPVPAARTLKMKSLEKTELNVFCILGADAKEPTKDSEKTMSLVLYFNVAKERIEIGTKTSAAVLRID